MQTLREQAGDWEEEEAEGREGGLEVQEQDSPSSSGTLQQLWYLLLFKKNK